MTSHSSAAGDYQEGQTGIISKWVVLRKQVSLILKLEDKLMEMNLSSSAFILILLILLLILEVSPPKLSVLEVRNQPSFQSSKSVLLPPNLQFSSELLY